MKSWSKSWSKTRAELFFPNDDEASFFFQELFTNSLQPAYGSISKTTVLSVPSTKSHILQAVLKCPPPPDLSIVGHARIFNMKLCLMLVFRPTEAKPCMKH